MEPAPKGQSYDLLIKYVTFPQKYPKFEEKLARLFKTLKTFDAAPNVKKQYLSELKAGLSAAVESLRLPIVSVILDLDTQTGYLDAEFLTKLKRKCEAKKELDKKLCLQIQSLIDKAIAYRQQPIKTAPYQKIPERYASSPDVPRTHVYGNMPVKPTGSWRQSCRTFTGAPLRVPLMSVEPANIVLATPSDVRQIILSVNSVSAVETGPSLVPGKGTGLFAKKHFDKGEVVAHYDGELITDEEARMRTLEGMSIRIRTLHANHWHIDGFFSIDEVQINRGMGSLAVDNLNLHESVTNARECRYNDVELNTDLVVLTDACNADASAANFDPARAFLVLVARRNIKNGDEILVKHYNLADFCSL
jgi:hypothetical protein